MAQRLVALRRDSSRRSSTSVSPAGAGARHRPGAAGHGDRGRERRFRQGARSPRRAVGRRRDRRRRLGAGCRNSRSATALAAFDASNAPVLRVLLERRFVRLIGQPRVGPRQAGQPARSSGRLACAPVSMRWEAPQPMQRNPISMPLAVLARPVTPRGPRSSRRPHRLHCARNIVSPPSSVGSSTTMAAG
jgi:hypothetical protein